MTVSIAPALIGADPLALRDAIDSVAASTAKYLHLDIMDGHYTPAISFGMRTVAAIRHHTSLPLEVHLQTLEPERYIDDLIEIGADRVCFHVDAATDISTALDTLQLAGIGKGLVLNPDLGLELLDPYFGRVDFVVLMTSRPGTSTFEPAVPDKIRALRTLLRDRQLDTVELVADGGITTITAPQTIEAGADTLVAGSAIFSSTDPDLSTAVHGLAQPVQTTASVQQH
ncbi:MULTISPECIES: ribulose-phosphate 3-epimerase [Nocardia]|uniref:Ribulose-5-phosphate 3-epimerase n=1 Tax=Nocardia asteroides NBRC 15531 TaxID=1110697 RepID=U5EL53_NOCAS|nr:MULTISPECIES: ribulose-phosphate 3-epimerase [Nocardia]TLF63361.1 ribulose-phosphate 3-epimerase [Nocardia asteroides NBRC 15531]GAD87063.1 ribulose-5-phosphate 3-epimerase [Nocardia asteroides NBRC 15531]SFM76141.1 ribulose-phosphate 3-epimerase [Nocardia asteroides]VEG33903.1 Ribulose-phosphate 3-epimerase [Nocardia asteroides]